MGKMDDDQIKQLVEASSKVAHWLRWWLEYGDGKRCCGKSQRCQELSELEDAISTVTQTKPNQEAS